MDTRSFATPFLALATVLAPVVGPAFASGLATRPGGVVQCRPVWQPAHAALVAGETGLPVDRVRLFAPTRQAVFFSRPGDRCAWRGDGLARG